MEAPKQNPESQIPNTKPRTLNTGPSKWESARALGASRHPSPDSAPKHGSDIEDVAQPRLEGYDGLHEAGLVCYFSGNLGTLNPEP